MAGVIRCRSTVLRTIDSTVSVFIGIPAALAILLVAQVTHRAVRGLTITSYKLTMSASASSERALIGSRNGSVRGLEYPRRYESIWPRTRLEEYSRAKSRVPIWCVKHLSTARLGLVGLRNVGERPSSRESRVDGR